MKKFVMSIFSVVWSCVALAWTISPTSKGFGVNGGSFTLTISGTEYYDWTANAWADWITVTRVNDKKFTVTVAANNTSAVREDQVRIYAYQAGSTQSPISHIGSEACWVTQAAQDKPSVSPTAISFPIKGDSVSVSVTAASADSWSVSGVPSWLGVNAYSGKGSGTVTLTAFENAGYEPRSATLTIAGQAVTVTQESITGYSKIVYENLHGADNPNPGYYKEGDGLLFAELGDIDGYTFDGWTPSGIGADSTGVVEVVAHWRSVDCCAIVGVEARQRYPWNGKVDVSYVVTGDVQRAAHESGYCVEPVLIAEDRETGLEYKASAIEGELSVTAGTHTVVWDMERQGIHLNSTNVVFHLRFQRKDSDYCVMDLSRCGNSPSEWIEYVDEIPSGGWTSEHKTKKLVMRRIVPGTFQMQGTVPVKFCNPYYIAVFEFTAGQNGLISGMSSSSCLAMSGVTYNEIRGSEEGSKWPTSNGVDETSIIGRLRSRTGMMFDLPTEAQWECAYRAGVNTEYPWCDRDYNHATADDFDIAHAHEWYTANTAYGAIHEVGTRIPNGWGLYDMGGNVGEWCLDRYGDSVVGGIDPVGPTTGQYRVVRGGHGASYYWELALSYRCYGDPSLAGELAGFRIVWMLPPDKLNDSDLDGVSSSVHIDTKSVTHAPTVTVQQEYDTFAVSIEWENDWPVHFTTDGQNPTVESAVYDGNLIVSVRGSKTLKAIAISPSGQQSEMVTLEIPAPKVPTISPANKTILTAPSSVNIASDNPDATIYCTTDGSEPTTSSPVYKRFKASTKMTVKAIAVVEGMAWSETTTAEYALGQCADPTITPTDGTVFGGSNYQVSITKNGEKGVLRYTTDGSDPTVASPIYSGPFAISETTTVKAKVFDTDYFDSAVVSATLTRQWTKVATPVIVAPASFSGTKLSVSLTCATDGAVIRYTTDGSEPNSHSPKYTKPFDITGTTVVKAIALKTDCTTSDVATMTITKQWCIGDALNDSDRQFTTDVGTGWVRDTSVSHDGIESMKSGAITDSATMGVYATSTLSTVVDGKGTVHFWWKASCEEDDDYEWDHGEFRVDGVAVAKINGAAGWGEVSYEITTTGSHALSWIYCKDDFGAEEDDCIWLDNFCWNGKVVVLVSLSTAGTNRVVVGQSTQYACTAQYNDGSSRSVTASWSVVSGTDCAEINGTTGLLTAKKNGTVRIQASYTEDAVTKTAAVDVTIVKGLTGVSVSGLSKLYAGDSSTYVCTATYTDGSSASVSATWTLTSGANCASLKSTGVLTARDADGEATLTASYTYEGVAKTATRTVQIVRQIAVSSETTGGKAFNVPVSWTRKYPKFKTQYGQDLATAMSVPTGKKDGANKALRVWDDYVAGTDPTDAEDVFRTKVEMVDGLPHVSWEPNLNEDDQTRTYKVYGRRSLSGSDTWEHPANSAVHQFFKVNVAMPDDNDGGSDAPGEVESWRSVAIPTAIGGLVYDGTVKQGVPPGAGYALSGASATAASDYVAHATLASGYRWANGQTAEQQIPWTIAKAENVWLSLPTMSSTSFKKGSTVTLTKGSARFGTVVANYTATDLAALTAGSYFYTCYVNGTGNYTGVTKTIPFTVTSPATLIAAPTAKTGLSYTGSTQYGVASGTGYTLTGNSAINAGSYKATATLQDGYAWSDGTTSKSRTISWSIAKATNSWLTQPSLSSTEFAEGTAVTISMGSVKFGVRQANYTAAELAGLPAGSYTLVVSVAGTSNYTGLTKSISFTVTGVVSSSQLYCVVDLSGGTSATKYPVEYLNSVPSGGWGDESKTTKLVLRRVSKGSYSMLGTGATTISKDFYIGIFEVTQKQYGLVMGTSPATGYGVGDSYPVYNVSYNDIRGSSLGAGWPSSSAVDSASFFGKLRARTALNFDLPTEAQWEYACRAGTTGKYYWSAAGLSTSVCAWYISNSSYATHNVGLKRSNDWGLFDMSGNVSEWCLDWYSSSLSYGTDPKGPSSATYNRRVTRGGCYSSGESDLRMDDRIYQYGVDASTRSTSVGFRVIMLE